MRADNVIEYIDTCMAKSRRTYEAIVRQILENDHRLVLQTRTPPSQFQSDYASTARVNFDRASEHGSASMAERDQTHAHLTQIPTIENGGAVGAAARKTFERKDAALALDRDHRSGETTRPNQIGTAGQSAVQSQRPDRVSGAAETESGLDQCTQAPPNSSTQNPNAHAIEPSVNVKANAAPDNPSHLPLVPPSGNQKSPDVPVAEDARPWQLTTKIAVAGDLVIDSDKSCSSGQSDDNAGDTENLSSEAVELHLDQLVSRWKL